MPSYVRAGIRKCARIRALSEHFPSSVMLLGMQIMNAYGSCHKIGELKPGQICFLANTMEIKHAFY